MPAAVDNLWRSPLVPVALAATAGIVLDRFVVVPLTLALVAVVALLIAWAATRRDQAGLPLLYLLGAVTAFGAAYHHVRYRLYRGDDIGHFAMAEPGLAQVRGVLVDGPTVSPSLGGPLRSFPRPESTTAILRLTELHGPDGWAR